jgi:hypothetical protein
MMGSWKQGQWFRFHNGWAISWQAQLLRAFQGILLGVSLLFVIEQNILERPKKIYNDQ